MTRSEAIERARRLRMARVWLASEPTEAEVVAARSRFFARGRHRRRGRSLSLVLTFAALLVGGAAFASARLYAIHDAAPSPVGATAPSRVTAARAPSAAVPARPPLASGAAAPPETAAVPVEDLPVASATTAPADPKVPTPAVRVTRAEGSATRMRASTPAAAPSSAPNPWVEAADAMRRGDHATAERAFGTLIASGDPHVRDEARLARAQIWVADGRIAEARPELERLAATGATVLVRDSARDALAKLDSSGAPAVGTNEP